MSERAPCKCHGSWPRHADDQAADLRASRAENERLREALRLSHEQGHTKQHYWDAVNTAGLPNCPLCTALAKDSTKGGEDG